MPWAALAGGLASLFGGAKAATAPMPKMDPALYGTPDASMLNPALDSGYQQTANNLMGTAQRNFAGGIPQIASMMAARFGGGASPAGAPGMTQDLLANAHNAAFGAVVPQLAGLMQQQRQNAFSRYMSAMGAARQWAMMRAQQTAQQRGQLTGGLMGLGGKLVGAGLSGLFNKAPGGAPAPWQQQFGDFGGASDPFGGGNWGAGLATGGQ